MEEKPIMYVLGLTHKKFKDEVRKEVIRNNVPQTYYEILKYLNNNSQKEVNQVDLCNYLSFKPSSISLNLLNMEHEGLIIREKSQKDSRKLSVKLTDKGLEYFNNAKKAYKTIDSRIEKSLKKEDEIALRKILEKINKCLEGDQS